MNCVAGKKIVYSRENFQCLPTLRGKFLYESKIFIDLMLGTTNHQLKSRQVGNTGCIKKVYS